MIERDLAADLLLVAAQQARLADPQTAINAQARVKVASAAARRVRYLANTQFARLRVTPGLQKKIHWLHKMADTFGAAIGPHAACSPGCDACCHIPVTISAAEAQHIAVNTGAVLVPPVAWPGIDMTHVGHACPFLVDQRCSIYQHRPLPCRVQYSMDADDLLCHAVPGYPSEVPYANASQINDISVAMHVGSLGNQAAMLLGDIRDFFPNGLKNDQ